MQIFDFNFTKGSVWIVGAGPGDPGLLSLLAYKSIKKADVIFYDALLDDHILSIAKPKAELVFVGKRGNKKSINQLEINKLLIIFAVGVIVGSRLLRFLETKTLLITLSSFCLISAGIISL